MDEFAPGELLLEFLDDGGWRRADTVIEDIDSRVLIVGPGQNSEHEEVTKYAVALLRYRRMHPIRLSPGAPDEVVAQASTVPFVVCLVCTIGTASETALLLSKIETNVCLDGRLPKIVVFVPSAHANAHFAVTAADIYGAKVVGCPDFAPGDELGLAILRALAGPVRAAAEGQTARANSAATSGLDDSARRAHLPAAPRPGNGVRAVVTLGGMFAIALLAAAGALRIAPDAAPIVVPLAAIVAVVVLVLAVVYLAAEGVPVPSALRSIIYKALDVLGLPVSPQPKLPPPEDAPEEGPAR